MAESGNFSSSSTTNPSMNADLKQRPRSLLLDDIKSLYESKDLSDVTFVVQGSRFQGHRSFLAVRSAYFKALLFRGFAEASQSEIEIKEVEPSIFEAMLKYLYTEELDLARTSILDLLDCAKRFDVPSLQAECLEFLYSHLSFSNVFSVLSRSLELVEAKMTHHCMEFLRANPQFVPEIIGEPYLPGRPLNLNNNNASLPKMINWANVGSLPSTSHPSPSSSTSLLSPASSSPSRPSTLPPNQISSHQQQPTSVRRSSLPSVQNSTVGMQPPDNEHQLHDNHSSSLCESLAALSLDGLIEILQDSEIEVFEIQMFRFALKWTLMASEQNNIPKDGLFASLLPHLRFPLLSVESLVEVEAAHVVPPETMCTLFSSAISSHMMKSPLPEDFPFSSCKRESKKRPSFLLHRSGLNHSNAQGSWGYCGAHDAVSVRVSRSIRLYGLGLFSGKSGELRGVISVKMGSSVQGEVCLGSSPFVLPAGSDVKQVLFATPIVLKPDTDYTLVESVESTKVQTTQFHVQSSSTTIHSEGTTFKFFNSENSLNNGTTALGGQIPCLYWSHE